ncbi:MULTISPECIES: site-specific integrase [Enterococcus]|uniref:site-specific integrase n=1 Tax=Enterococcus TaxID=1350 RepID=UPI001902E0F6|nr:MULTISPECIES: site-specific integrase [Enterococcus]MBK0038897.1 site-specific integrase [Enterococcus sp. S52]MBK0070800.1 site-specific integrase [Enterococcus sp. S53]MBK0142339.1 site-specific integrase [Enterococcus sp. S76]MBK0146036.1 site-specific integrase [Enterococcus sp. S77]MBX9120982.1 site-specific integrase [Enterococcus sp. K18_3]
MSITKTKNNTYRLRLYYPQDIQEILGIKKLYSKTFKSRKEAKNAEVDFYGKIKEVRANKEQNALELGGETLFKDFYTDIWLDAYTSGLTTNNTTPPTVVTIGNTKDVFRIHILPMFGKYTLNYLNRNKTFVLQLMTKKAAEYANFKTLRSYVNSIFDWAEELDYIERNKLGKSLRRIKATKKNQLRQARKEDDLYLSFEQLQEWLIAVQNDHESGQLILQDYVLFLTTFFLSDRKSETYAIRWKDVNFTTSQITIGKALDKFGNEKSTKGNKITIFHIPNELKQLLQQWKDKQKEELAQFEIEQTEEQLLFTFFDNKGNINQRLHTDYLNYRMKSIERRHKHLTHATPHKLRHTGATLAKQSGVALEQISEALTHSDTNITRTYVNTPNVIQMPIGEIAYRKLSQKESDRNGVNNGVNSKKDASQSDLRNA